MGGLSVGLKGFRGILLNGFNNNRLLNVVTDTWLLFEDCISFVINQNLRKSGNAISIYSCELALHCIALYMAKGLTNANKLYVEKCIKNTTKEINNRFWELINSDSSKSISKAFSEGYIARIIKARAELIYIEKDFEVRNFNFVNLCNNELSRIGADEIFIITDIEKLGIVSSSPFDLFVLPAAYKIGLIDKYLNNCT